MLRSTGRSCGNVLDKAGDIKSAWVLFESTSSLRYEISSFLKHGIPQQFLLFGMSLWAQDNANYLRALSSVVLFYSLLLPNSTLFLSARPSFLAFKSLGDVRCMPLHSISFSTPIHQFVRNLVGAVSEGSLGCSLLSASERSWADMASSRDDWNKDHWLAHPSSIYKFVSGSQRITR